MNIVCPERYVLAITPMSFAVVCERGTSKFSGISTSRKPKLNVVSVEGEADLSRLTKQPIRNGLRLGWNAKGQTGYSG
jgi:hypothetical protein